MAAPKIDPLPDAPRRSNPDGFSQTMDTFLGHLPVMAGEMNALAVWMEEAAMNAQDGLEDASKGKLMRVGAFGVGAPIDVAGGDLDAAAYGFGANAGASSAPGNVPVPVGDGSRWAWMTAGNSNASLQLAARADAATDLHYRVRSLHDWDDWRKVWDTENVLGKVKRAGGKLTGGLVERGENASGEFHRWADGTQICRMVLNVPEITDNGNSGGLYRSEPFDWTFPAAFVASGAAGGPTVQGTVLDYFGLMVGSPSGGRTSVATSLRAYSVEPRTNIDVSLMAVGRWY